MSIILLSYNAFGLQKLDTEPLIPRGCHQKIFQKSFLPLCKGRELRGYASFRCLSTWTSRTCRLSRRPLACSPFFPQGHAWLQKHASAHEPAPKSEKIIGQTRLRMAMRSGILLCWRLRMLMKRALKLYVLPSSRYLETISRSSDLQHNPTLLVADKCLRHLRVEGCPSMTGQAPGPALHKDYNIIIETE